MAQKITSNAAQSAATNSSTAELLKALQEAWAENAALKKQLAEKDKELKKALRAAVKWQGKLEKRQKAAAASISTSQPKATQTKPAVASTKKEAIIKPSKAEPVIESTKGTTYENIESVKTPNKKPLPELRRQKAEEYKNDVLVPTLIDNIEEHYGDKWPDDWSIGLAGMLEMKSAKDLAYTIKTLGLTGAYYPSSSSTAYDDHSVQWPEKPEDLYVGLTGMNPPIFK